MERVRSLILTAGLAVLLTHGSGCISVNVDGDGKLKSITPGSKGPGAVPTTDATDPAKSAAKVDPQVKQASATSVAPAMSMPALPKISLKPEGGKSAVVSVVPMWQNRIAFLPDPSQNGAMGSGLVGQIFMFGPNDQFVPANGKLTVELFDETPKGVVPVVPVKLGQWVFDKETLARLVTMDERFGKSYAMFLPWPTYKSEVARVRLTVRIDPDNGHTLYAPASTLTIDTSTTGGGSSSGSANPGGAGLGGPGLLPASGFSMPAGGPGTVAPISGYGTPIPVGGPTPIGGPLPAGFSNPVPGGAMPTPGNLPPIVITAPRR